MTDFALAEAQIRQLYARYTDAVWRKDVDAFGDCFTEDAQWRIAGNVLQGRSQIVSMIQQVFPRYERILLNFRVPVLQVGDGTANARTLVNELSVREGQAFGPIGTYFDRCVQQGECWRFSWRLFQTHYAGPPDLSGQFFDNPDFGAPPAMPPLDAPAIDHTGNLKKS